MQEHLSFTAEENNVKVVRVIVNTVSASSQSDELCNLAKVACLLLCNLLHQQTFSVHDSFTLLINILNSPLQELNSYLAFAKMKTDRLFCLSSPLTKA